jgi:hypothetical protein
MGATSRRQPAAFAAKPSRTAAGGNKPRIPAGTPVSEAEEAQFVKFA